MNKMPLKAPILHYLPSQNLVILLGLLKILSNTCFRGRHWQETVEYIL